MALQLNIGKNNDSVEIVRTESSFCNESLQNYFIWEDRLSEVASQAIINLLENGWYLRAQEVKGSILYCIVNIRKNCGGIMFPMSDKNRRSLNSLLKRYNCPKQIDLSSYASSEVLQQTLDRVLVGLEKECHYDTDIQSKITYIKSLDVVLRCKDGKFYFSELKNLVPVNTGF